MVLEQIIGGAVFVVIALFVLNRFTDGALKRRLDRWWNRK
jgi:hypothetical protein